MTTYFWSDTHFGDSKLLLHRGFVSVKDMNRSLINRWNSTVSPSDTVYHLGDFARDIRHFLSLYDIFSQLNGTKHLIQGNHDHKLTRRLPWDSISHVSFFEGAVLIHDPEDIDPQGCLVLHGHTHGTVGDRFNFIDVGVDNFARPISWEQVWSYNKTRGMR